ncbi:RNase PH-related exoribonuclease [Aciduliprofundum sp. MAR08-339]|uniref:exosome complex protein Rrp42 n=1 Tax=Aciduliprofundum sp. (strain MAR08-339) TaxID=673860 RepID=UPI0002A4A805|nr:RNase PH-related exoribonuclease [Aciduliprofundum sp. MAR08-339]
MSNSKFTAGVVPEMQRKYIHKLASQGTRVDGRNFDEIRELKIVRGKIPRAEGSALVELGRTKVLVGVKIEPGTPFPDTPAQGILTTNAELSPMASPTFEPGPPGEEAIELARVVDRGIREGHAIDLEKLVIEEGEQVWVVFIDIHVLDYDGNLFDASGYGALAALTEATVPAAKHELGEDFKLPVQHYPVPVTFAKIGNWLVADPNLDEESIASARLTVTTNEEGKINAMQKGLSGTFTYEEVQKAINMSMDIGRKVRDIILGDSNGQED